MKVLLIKDVKKGQQAGSPILGFLGDVVETSAGFARNWLFPQGLAVMPTEANIKAIATKKAARVLERRREIEQFEQTTTAVQGAEVVIAGKANPAGALFGSVTPSAIADNLRQQGFEVAAENVHLDKNIKQVGTYPDTVVKFSEDLTATITVIVVAEPEQ